MTYHVLYSDTASQLYSIQYNTCTHTNTAPAHTNTTPAHNNTTSAHTNTTPEHTNTTETHTVDTEYNVCTAHVYRTNSISDPMHNRPHTVQYIREQFPCKEYVSQQVVHPFRGLTV